MTDVDQKTPEELLKNLGGADEHSKKFGETFFGSLIGQSRAFVVQLTCYFAVIFGALKYFGFEPEQLAAAYGRLALVILFGAPFLCIFLFSIFPAIVRAHRETRQKEKAISGESRFHPGYFRLTPYDESDHEKFVRLDGADDMVFNWLTHTNQSLLYLSGASGAGKTSLLAANIIPRLRAEGYGIVTARLFGDPLPRIRAALVGTNSLFPEQPDPKASLRDLLSAAAKAHKAPLLLIVDQFEEFLILNTPEQRAPLAAFLDDLKAKPIEGVRLLLVFRSDYRALIFKFNLPSLILGRNWMEIAPYARGEATEFLQKAGRNLSEKALNDLFRGLDSIEGAQGIYRLITLNMVGLILERMGQNLDDDPAQLIQKYLLVCLTSSEGSEYARPVLEQMITDAGTKEPKTEAALTQSTRLEPWQIKTALAGMEEQGLTRRLEGDEPTWEISHDFIARALGRIIGRLKPSWFQLARPYIVWATLISWTVYLGFIAPDQLRRASEQRIIEHASITKNNEGDYEVRFRMGATITNSVFGLLASDLKRLPGTLGTLELSATKVSDISALKDFSELKRLSLSATEVSNIDALKDLKSLQYLYLGQTRVSDIRALRGLKDLIALDLSETAISDIDALKDLRRLQMLNLSRTEVSDIGALKDLTSLESLELSQAPVSDLNPLKDLKSLNVLFLSQTHVSDISALKDLTNLAVIDLSETSVSDVQALKRHRNLRSLDLSKTEVTNIDALKNFPARVVKWDPPPSAAPKQELEVSSPTPTKSANARQRPARRH